ncbi:MAG TPA: 1-acyl-sn-glycerol-3-phosphate acyltransferase, partial [Myxococcales bacterium]|nr:1-acyl-sn-glycerol-3-phosphate acyltransferase [Myxococcales bacterium]
MDTAIATQPGPEAASRLRRELGPFTRMAAARYFEPVRFTPEAEAELRKLSEQGLVIHVMRTTAWLNFVYLVWLMATRGLPPVRAVVNLRPWFTRPWRNAAQRGDIDVRFTYARRQGGSGLIFLRRSALGVAEGRSARDDPFPALVAMARKSDRPVFLVPELFVWEKKTARLVPSVLDRIFGSPDAPGFLHSVLAFWRNHRRAQFRVGEPLDLTRFVAENAGASDEVLARKVRGTLHVHLARETRSVFGPPVKPHARLIEETLRDRVLRKSLEEHAAATSRSIGSVTREARRNLLQIAARRSPVVLGLVSPVLTAVLNRIYESIEVDEARMHRALKSAGRAPVVLCASHKSHLDYIVLGWVLWTHGYNHPLVAAGANLSFFPFGPFARRGGAFFLRRSFKGDAVYTATFKAYIKKLIADGLHQEFFPEGGRSRTGKLLQPKLGMFTWQVDAFLEGAANDVVFIPIAVDYEKVAETRSYSKELLGGEKKPEDFKALLSTPKVLLENFGRIYITFDEPVSLVDLMKSRGLEDPAAVTEEQKKGLVRALGNRVMYGISRVSTVTAGALASAALLSHRRRGATSREIEDRISLLRRICEQEQAPLSRFLQGAPSGPTAAGPIQDAMRTFEGDGMVTSQEAKGEVIYQAADERRLELAFYKNTLMNVVVGRSLVANALLVEGGRAPLSEVRRRALFLSRLFKVEFIYRVGMTFETIFDETVDKLVQLDVVKRDGEALAVVEGAPGRAQLEFLADLLRDFLESYLLAAMTVQDLATGGSMDKKAFLKAALETGRSEFLAGRISAAEALSRPTFENAVSFLLDQKALAEDGKLLKLG